MQVKGTGGALCTSSYSSQFNQLSVFPGATVCFLSTEFTVSVKIMLRTPARWEGILTASHRFIL